VKGDGRKERCVRSPCRDVGTTSAIVKDTHLGEAQPGADGFPLARLRGVHGLARVVYVVVAHVLAVHGARRHRVLLRQKTLQKRLTGGLLCTHEHENGWGADGSGLEYSQY
jgi:hypothetical protein